MTLGSSKRSESHEVKVDLVTEHPETGVFAIILVETGPWPSGAEEREVRRIQDRLYDCVDLAVDGHLAAKYPDSRGRSVRIQLDTYDIREELVRPFSDRFVKHVDTWSEVSAGDSRQTEREVDHIRVQPPRHRRLRPGVGTGRPNKGMQLTRAPRGACVAGRALAPRTHSRTGARSSSGVFGSREGNPQ